MNKEKEPSHLSGSSFFLLMLAFFIYSATGIFSKLASEEDFLSTGYIVSFGCVILSLGVYAVLWQVLLKRIPLSRAYLFKSVTIVFSLLFAHLFFKEQITIQNLIGSALIVSGIVVNAL